MLVRARLGGERRRRRSPTPATAATGGNPLLLRQLLDARSRPSGVQPDAAHADVVARDRPARRRRARVLLRLARLPADAGRGRARRRGARRAAPSCRPSRRSPALDERAVAEAAAALARAEILRPSAPLGFVHPLVRDAVYRELPPGERELEHARAARVLAERRRARRRTSRRSSCTRRARGDRGSSSALREAAARRAAPRRAPRARSPTCTRALERAAAAERARRGCCCELGGCAEALTSAGRPRAEHLRAGLRRADRSAAARGARRRRPAPAAVLHARRRPRPRSPSAALAELPDAERTTCAALRGARLDVTASARRRRSSRRSPLARRAAADARATGAGARMLAGAWPPATWRCRAGRPTTCAALALRALGDGDAARADDNGLLSDRARCIALALRRPRRGARRVGRRARRRPPPRLAVRRLGAAPVARLRRSCARRPREAEAAARRRATSSRTGATARRAVRLLRRRSSARALRRRAATCRRRARRSSWRRTRGRRLRRRRPLWLLAAGCELLLAEGRHEEALRGAPTSAEPRAARARPEPGARPVARRCRPRRSTALGRTDEALPLASRTSSRSRARCGAPARARPARCACSARCRATTASRRCEEAVAVARRLARAARARARRSPRSARRCAARAGRPTRASRCAARSSSPTSAAPRAARSTSAPSSTRPARARARPRLAGVGALTASERRVAALAAEGQTNRDIAQALFVTPKTVEVHLSNAYRKLGIRSRRELAARARLRPARWPGRGGPAGKMRRPWTPPGDSSSRSGRATRRGPSSSGSSTPG